MKVVVITHNYIRRQGDLTALYLHRLSSGLMEKDIEISVLCPHAPGLLKEDVIDGVKIYRFSYPFSKMRPIVYSGNMHGQVAGSFFAKIVFLGLLRAFYKSALSFCRKEKPDLIWANWWIPPGMAAAKAAKKLNLPLIISSHGTDISLLAKSGLAKKLARNVYRNTACASVVSSFLKKRLIDNVDTISDNQVAIIPMPVGMETFTRTPFQQKKEPLFLSVARYTKQKHLEDILNAASRLHKEGLKFRIKMVGEGPLESNLQKLVVESNLSDIVEIGPLVSQQKLAELYRQCDCVLLVSEGEGFGLTLVEAGLSGRPVIGAKSGGITDAIEHNVNGLLIELGNIDALAECMKTIITGTEIRDRLGEGGYKIAMEKFSTPVLVSKIHELFVSTVRNYKQG